MASNRYISTRCDRKVIGFQEAVLTGLAEDGGLILPQSIPRIGKSEISKWRKLSYPELACEIMSLFIDQEEIPKSDLRELVHRSYQKFRNSEIVPTVPVGPLYIVELFHGPTLAFKDIALQFLGNLFEYILANLGGELNLLGATSGDTGSAAIHGVRGKSNIQIFIMHPDGKISPIQKKQMTTVLDPNVFNLAINGSFDDGQRIMKEIFSDQVFKNKYCLGTVNSVNWARVMAQIVYYFYSSFRVQEISGCDKVQFSVPTGNFGDIFAGYLAKAMGGPIHRLILATNENNILSNFFNTGDYRKGEVQQTLSPSMDIQVASNFERYLYYRLDGDTAAVREILNNFEKEGRIEITGTDPCFAAGEANQQNTLKTITDYHHNHDYLLDPHTAVGAAVGERFSTEEFPTICLATAHPAKFPEAIKKALGSNLAYHPILAEIMEKPSRCLRLPANRKAVQDFIANTLSSQVE